MKKILSFLLSVLIVFHVLPAMNAHGAENPMYIPLINAVESCGGTVKWDTKKSEIYVNHKGIDYKYCLQDPESTEYFMNGKPQALSAPLLLKDGQAYVNYDDVVYLYGGEKDKYKETKKNAVVNAYTLILKDGIPGITMSFIDSENNYIWNQGFGYSDVENKKIVTSKTLYNIASISKVFTASAVMQMVDQGKIRLDGKLKDYLPDFSVRSHPVYGGNPDNITIEMMMTHFSGLPEDIFDGFYTTESTDEKYMNNLVKNFKNEYMVNKEMNRWNYSNAAVSLLGVIISRLTGESNNVYKGFVDYTNTNLFKKMGMSMSSFDLNKDLKPYVAKSYSDNASSLQEDLYVNCIPAGGMYSNAEDMARYMGYILNDGTYDCTTVLSPKSVNKMLTPINWDMPLNPELKIGMMWMTGDYKGVKMVGHGGDVDYFHSDLQINKDEKLGVFVSMNSANSIYMPQYLSAETLSAAYAEKTGKAIAEAPKKETTYKPLTRKEVEPYCGRYSDIGNISCDDAGNIVVDRYKLVYKHQNDGTFYDSTSGQRIRFKNIAGKMVILYVVGDTEMVTAERVVQTKADNSFDEWLGTYLPVTSYKNNHTTFKSISFKVDEEGYPSMSIAYKTDSALEIEKICNDNYYVPGTGRGHGGVVYKYNKNGKIYIHFSGVDYVKIN